MLPISPATPTTPAFDVFVAGLDVSADVPTTPMPLPLVPLLPVPRPVALPNSASDPSVELLTPVGRVVGLFVSVCMLPAAAATDAGPIAETARAAAPPAAAASTARRERTI